MAAGNWRESRGCKLEFDFATERSMIIKELNCDGKFLNLYRTKRMGKCMSVAA